MANIAASAKILMLQHQSNPPEAEEVPRVSQIGFWKSTVSRKLGPLCFRASSVARVRSESNKSDLRHVELGAPNFDACAIAMSR